MSRAGALPERALGELARLHGIQLSYRDVAGGRHRASLDVVLRLLRALGVSVRRAEDAPGALREARRAHWDGGSEPVVVTWDGRGALSLRLAASDSRGTAEGRLSLESGGGRDLRWDLGRLPVLAKHSVDGRRHEARALPLSRIPAGYHRLTVRAAGQEFESLVISAPTRAYGPPPGERRWGVFVPLYALHSRQSWGAGDFTDLERLMGWVAARGGSVVATLPLLAAYLDEPFEPSPYSPASRLFWNDFYLDLSRVPEAGSPAARAVRESPAVERDIEAARRAGLVDYRGIARAKRGILDAMARALRDDSSGRATEFRAFLAENPEVERFAEFLAGRRSDRRGPRNSGGSRVPREVGADAARAHACGQWLADGQLAEVARTARDSGVLLHLDVPLGVHPSGYDPWRDQDLFVPDVSAGAPPDTAFPSGQDWGFEPVHPERVRTRGYGYAIESLRNQLRYASILRLDHVMSLHRLFWIPRGVPARRGAYVRYHADEWYAILSLESHRYGAVIVGENLGTVPASVNDAMQRHGILGMYVAQYEAEAREVGIPPPVPEASVASVNTHDMPPFAAYWRGLDIEARVHRGLLDAVSARKERARRERIRRRLVRSLRERRLLTGPATEGRIYRALLAYLASSPAWALLVNLEDLWGETEPTNLPGTGSGPPNWRRKLRYSLEEIERSPEVLEALDLLNARRRMA